MIVYDNVEQMLDSADKIVEKLCKMFPHVSREDIAVNVLLYLLNNTACKVDPTEQ